MPCLFGRVAGLHSTRVRIAVDEEECGPRLDNMNPAINLQPGVIVIACSSLTSTNASTNTYGQLRTLIHRVPRVGTRSTRDIDCCGQRSPSHALFMVQ